MVDVKNDRINELAKAEGLINIVKLENLKLPAIEKGISNIIIRRKYQNELCRMRG